MSCSRSVAGVPDAIIREVDSLPERLEGATQYAPNAQALHGVLLLNMPGVARYLVKDGRSIDVAIAPGASPQDVRCFLFGAARSALIHQRGEMPLHAATLLPPAGTRASRCVVPRARVNRPWPSSSSAAAGVWSRTI